MLVGILLWEGDVACAWAQAQAGGCSRDLWRRLARERAAEHPLDAVGVYRLLLERTIDLKNDGAYAEAIQLLAELHGLLAPIGHEDAHARLVTEVGHAHRRKRNLIRMLDAHAFRAVLDDHPGELTRFNRFSDERQRGRTRRWLAGHGLRAAR